LIAAVTPRGATFTVRLIVPEKPLRLDRVTVEVAEPTHPRVRLEGLAEMEKSGCPAPLVNVAAWTISGTGTGVPFAIVTQTPPLTLVFVQPVWKPRLVPEDVPVMLYIAANKRPVVGVEVMPDPRADVAASSTVSTVSVLEQVAPVIRTPERHSTIIVGVPVSTVPVRSMPAGRRIVWSAKRVTSKPFSPPEP
jgi:hypothetical protein